MTGLLATMLTSATLAQGAAVPTSCSLRSPSGDKIEFTASQSAGGWLLEPSASAVWPTGTTDARDVTATGDQKTRQFVVGDDETGIAIRLVPVAAATQLATALRLDRGKPTLPLAVGFCSAAATGAATAKPSPAVRRVAESAGAVDPARWRGTRCALISPDGRQANIDYTPFDRNRATFTSFNAWPWAGNVLVSRGRSAVNTARVRMTKLGGRGTLSATEYFYVHGSNAANVILFDRLSPVTGLDMSAAAICGYAGISRAPSSQ